MVYIVKNNKENYVVSLIESNDGSLIQKIETIIGSYDFVIKGRHTHRYFDGALSFEICAETSKLTDFKNKISEISSQYKCDVFVQPSDLKPRGLVVFDMDSTLIQHEVIVELAQEAGVSDEVSDITESAMRGEIDFSESFRRRMALLEGIDISVLDSIFDNLNMTPGASRLLTFLKEHGFKVAILSGGFTYFAERIRDKFGLDFVCANEIIVKDGKVTGEAGDLIVDADVKANTLQQLMEQYAFTADDVVAIGDGANDLKMIHKAGLGISYHGKALVRRESPYSINYSGLDAAIVFLQHND
ncbi:phosphoserine phosphatase SerB [Photobacterium lutimaris]|uniref:Phosphoserine phosphatase n=1 Tax=Photobacterium lutimaris TaxID=388278 RepID=A0A2T3IXD9_9GAMM|nr:phosphoserine phosphatase SerB [Photobacterium lutimaris]TDR75244.1 phosphoserine phosphatase [Photobacterium lutimaris]